MLYNVWLDYCVSPSLPTLLCCPWWPSRPAAFLGLVSAVFATGCLVQFIYLHVRLEVSSQQPHLLLLCVFGAKGAIGMSVGIGTFVAFLGLGIIDSVNHVGEFSECGS
jgi:hypothetical protein